MRLLSIPQLLNTESLSLCILLTALHCVTLFRGEVISAVCRDSGISRENLVFMWAELPLRGVPFFVMTMHGVYGNCTCFLVPV